MLHIFQLEILLKFLGVHGEETLHSKCLIKCFVLGMGNIYCQVCIRLLEECPRTFTLTLLHLIVGATCAIGNQKLQNES